MFVRHADEAVCLGPTTVLGDGADGSSTWTTECSSGR